MTHYTINCDWGCKYNSSGICERCSENVLKYRDRWIEYLPKKLWNSNFDCSCKEYKELEEKYSYDRISISEFLRLENKLRYIDVKISEVNLQNSLEELDPWQKDPDASWCWLRVVKGGDPNKIEDRRVFVEKTPRVFDPSLNIDITHCYSWIQGLKGSYCEGDEFDEFARHWSNTMAIALGYRININDGLN